MKLEHELHDELPARILELLFRSLLAGSSKRIFPVPAKKHVDLPTVSSKRERTSLQKGSMESVHDQLVSRSDFDFPSASPNVRCSAD